MPRAVGLSLFSALLLTLPDAASAGLLDKLKEVNEKMEQKNRQTQQQQQSSGGGYGGGSLSAGLGATKLEGLTDFNNCMAQTSFAHERLTAQVLRRKLKQSSSLNAKQRTETEEDIAWLEATAAGEKKPAPKAQRWLNVMTDDEQMEVSSTTNEYSNKVREKCDAKYGSMSNFSDAAGAARRAAVNAKVPFPNLENSAPKTFVKERTPMDDFMACQKGSMGLRWQIIADKMQAKFDRLNPTGWERKAWEEDIAVVRAAAEAPPTDPKAMPKSPDATNPMRYMMRLDGNEQMAINTEYMSASQAALAKCSAPSEQAEKARNRAQGEDLAKRAKEQAAANVKAQKVREERDAKAAADRATRGGGGSLSANLGATNLRYMQQASRCHDPIKGHMAKVTAEALETKLKSAKGLTPQQRQEWQDDIAAWRAAESAGADVAVPPDLDNPYRWQDRLTKAERQQINQQHSAFANKVNADCNAVDHMGSSTKY